MDRVLTKQAAARAMAAPAPAKKKKLVSTIIRPKQTKLSTVLPPTETSKKRKAAHADNTTPDHDLDFLSLFTSSFSSSSSSSSTITSTGPESSKPKKAKKATTSSSPSAPISKPRTGADVVIFDASKVGGKSSSTSSGTGSTEFNFKKFMSSKISKLDEAPAPMENPLTAEEKAEEKEMKRNDAELHTLIKASRLLEQYNADQLDGADRRRHQRDQLVNLGVQKKSKLKVPFQISLGMMSKQRERDIKELEEAKNNGTYHKSIKHTFAAAGGKKKEKSRSDRGLKSSMGRFKNGTLVLTEKEIKSVQREGVKKKKTPGKKSGGGAGGGGGKGSKKKKGKGRH
ncbi:hypothetical protein BG004_001358 [Podila humilis]|nr:hypothetical protein BG004_001358 [Podila humilis]